MAKRGGAAPVAAGQGLPVGIIQRKSPDREPSAASPKTFRSDKGSSDRKPRKDTQGVMTRS